MQQDADEERPWRAAAIERDLDVLRAFREFVSELRDEIRNVPRSAKWSDYSRRAELLLNRYLGGRSRFSEGFGTDQCAEVERELEAWDSIHDLLQSLIQLDELGETDSACFLTAVERGLDRPGRASSGFRPRRIRRSRCRSRAEWTGTWSSLSVRPNVRYLRRSVTILCCPKRCGPRSGLPELLIAHVTSALSTSQHSGRLRKSSSAIREQTYEDNGPACPVAGYSNPPPAFAPSASTDHKSTGSTPTVGSTERHHSNGPLQHSVRPGGAQEYDLRSIRRAAAPHKHYLAVSEPNLRRGFELQRARRSASFGEWDGHIVGGAPGYAQRAHSPTALQDWAVCPYRYFLGRVLRVAERDEAEDVLTISPLERGALIHDILDTFFRTVASSETSFDQWSNKHQQTLASIADSKMDFAEGRGVTGRDLLWKRERELIQNDLQALLEHDDKRRADHTLVQIESEFTYGLAGTPPVSFALSDGRIIHLRGKIDRIDESVDRTRLDVIDYKTGRADPSQSDLDQDPVMRGERLQLPVYAVAALQQRAESSLTEVSTSYWFITERGRFAKPQVTWDDKTTQRFRAVLGCIIDGIDQGLFPARPGDDGYRGPENCEHCAYDAVCSPDRQYSWNAIRPAPQLAAYVDLVEGELP